MTARTSIRIVGVSAEIQTGDLNANPWRYRSGQLAGILSFLFNPSKHNGKYIYHLL
jgi:hypothetical protein